MPQMRASAIGLGNKVVQLPGFDVSKFTNTELEALHAKLVFGNNKEIHIGRVSEPKAKPLGSVSKP